MNEIEIFGCELVDFIYDTDLKIIPEYYYDAFLNYLGVTYLGSTQPAISICLKALSDDIGKYYPFNRTEAVSLSDVALIDCFSSSLLAYDDIHFETTIHPCGPIMSAIFALSRKQKISLHEALNALCIGMEVECRLAIAIFSNETHNQSGWYTTGIVGAIGVASALSHLFKFTKEDIRNALALAANYASGLRGSHGSMAGSFIPAIASKNGFMSVMFVEKGMTCSFASLVGKNGLIQQMTSNPNIKKARDGIGKTYFSMDSSCKPYPFGFISFSAIALLEQVNIDDRNIDEIIVEVSSRVKMLGSNHDPKTMYDGFVSLPYIIAILLINHENAYLPLEDFHITPEIKSIMKKIIIKENKDLSDEEIYMTINQEKYYFKNAPGSIHNPMKHEDIIEKFKRITKINHQEQLIENIYHQDIQDIYQFIINTFQNNE